MSFYDTQTYCGILDMKVVVVGICNKINFTKVWITPTYMICYEYLHACKSQAGDLSNYGLKPLDNTRNDRKG